MESSKLVVKFFLDNPAALAAGEAVPVFHSLIQAHAIPDHLLIDVADYDHVPNGPGTVLVSHEANFHLDHEEGRPGLLYVRKQPIAGTFADRLRTVLRAALQACARLEAHPSLTGRVRFRTDEIVFRINDRLLGPNDAVTYAAVKPDLEAVLHDLYPEASASLNHRADPRRLFEVRIKTTESPGVEMLLARLGAPAVATA